jgi:hypothetical protein
MNTPRRGAKRDSDIFLFLFFIGGELFLVSTAEIATVPRMK